MQHSSRSLSVSRFRFFRILGFIVLLATGVSGACGGGQPDAAGGASGAGRGGAPGGVPVDIVTLELRPIEDISEYVGTVKSRRSTTIQPQVEGFLRRIAVTSGQRVAAGAVLAEIDNAPQQAAIVALQSTRAARDADATFARQQAQRMKSLLDIGAVSLVEAERAEATLKALGATTNLEVIDAQRRHAMPKPSPSSPRMLCAGRDLICLSHWEDFHPRNEEMRQWANERR